MKRAAYMVAAALMLGAAAPSMSFAADNIVTPSIDSQRLIGQTVKNFNNDTIGKIDSVILDQSGRAVAVVVGVGGFLGVGERDVALDWSNLQIMDNGATVRAPFTKDQLKAMPAYKFADAGQRNTVYYDRSYQAYRTNTPDAYRTNANAGWSTGSVYGIAGEMRTSKLIGAPVVNKAGEKIGEVADVLLSPKRELAAVISVGGFLGVGEHNVGIDLKKLRIERRGNADEFRVVLNATRDQLKAMPNYKFDSADARILR